MKYFLQETDGQLSFLESEEERVSDLLQFMNTKIKIIQEELQFLEKYINKQIRLTIQQDFYNFIVVFFKIYNSLTI